MIKPNVSEGMVVAFAWYSREQWEQSKEVADDPEALDDTYEEWLANARNTLLEFGGSGVKAVKGDLNIDTLSHWCAKHKRPNNSESRASYAAEMAPRCSAEQGDK